MNLGRKIHVLEASGLIDSEWYMEQYKDVEMLGMGAAEHYLRIGAILHRNPGPGFDTTYYLDANSDVVASGLNPLLHYVRYGRAEGRRCLPAPTAPADADAFRVAGAADTSKVKVRSLIGHKTRDAQCKTILVCAHIAGRNLFGGERSLLDVLDGFSELGFNVIVTIPGGGGTYVQALRQRSVEVLTIPYTWWGSGVPVDDTIVAEFAHVIAGRSIDVVHVNTIMLREPLVAARRMGVPAIAHVRELITHDESLCNRIGEEPARIVEQVVESCDWVIANSEATARCFAKPGRIRVVPNTVDESLFDIAGPSASDGIRVALISSNIPKKGVLDFIELAKLMQNANPAVRMMLVGPDNGLIEGLRQEQSAGDLPPNIIFSGYRERPVDAVSEADIVLNLSNFQESFGRTVLESMAGGRPVIVYDWGALPELVVDGETGYVVPFRDVAAVADRLINFCNDPAQIRRMGAAARKRAQEFYAKPHFTTNLKAAYSDIFSKSAQESAKPTFLPARSTRVADRSGEPPRIAYFLWHFPVPSETFVLNELRILVEAGHDVQVFCRQSPYGDFAPDFPIEWAQVQDANHLAEMLKKTGRTIVHSHFVYPTVTDMVWPACELAKIPFTFIAHAQDIFRYGNDRKNRIGEIGNSSFCLRVIVPSRFHREYVEERGVPANKILINPNGIDPDLYAVEADRKWRRRTKRSICAVHRFTEKKGLEHLIVAGRELAKDGIEIHLYGYGDLEKNYTGLIAENALTNVHLHGAIKSRAEMLEVFQEHDLFACPSVRASDGDMDGIPTVLMEAMAGGIPVLATAISGIPDLVRDGITGIVCEPTPDGIVQAVRRFYALPDSRVDAIVEDALALIRRDYNAVRLTSVLLRLWSHRTIDVIIVSWNNLPQLHEVIKRLHKYTSLPWHLIICDNDSDSPVLAHLCDVYAAYDNVSIIINRDNSFVGPGTNICLEHGVSDYVIYVCGKEGFVLDYGWEKPLVQYMDENVNVGQGGTLCYSPSYLTGEKYPDAIPEFPRFRQKSFAVENPDRRFSHVQGGFFILRRSMYEEIGGFSSEVPHNYTDVEYSYYIESQGWKLGAAPGLLALFNKTRPGIMSRVDESVAALHPPMLEDLPLLDRISRRSTVHCNVCGWFGEAFDESGGEELCAGCGSRPADRTLYRYLAESMLTYRRLPALGIDVGQAMDATWRRQFQGGILSGDELRRTLAEHGSLRFNPGSLKLVYYDKLRGVDGGDETTLREIDRVLAHDGVLLVRMAREWPGTSGYHPLLIETCRLTSLEPIRFSSQVVRYDSQPLYVGRRVRPDQCVS